MESSERSLVEILRELTSTAREMQAEAQETTDALLARRLSHYRGRILGLIDVANSGSRGSPSD